MPAFDETMQAERNLACYCSCYSERAYLSQKKGSHCSVTQIRLAEQARQRRRSPSRLGGFQRLGVPFGCFLMRTVVFWGIRKDPEFGKHKFFIKPVCSSHRSHQNRTRGGCSPWRMVVPKIRGPQYRSQYTLILVVGTPRCP